MSDLTPDEQEVAIRSARGSVFGLALLPKYSAKCDLCNQKIIIATAGYEYLCMTHYEEHLIDAARAAGRAETLDEQGWLDRYERLGARIEALTDVLERYRLYVDEWGYEAYGQLAKRFGPVEHEGSSISTEAWLDRVLREPARAALS